MRREASVTGGEESVRVCDMFAFPPDMDRVPTQINRLDNQILVRYFESEWGRYLAE